MKQKLQKYRRSKTKRTFVTRSTKKAPLQYKKLLKIISIIYIPLTSILPDLTGIDHSVAKIQAFEVKNSLKSFNRKLTSKFFNYFHSI